MGFKDLFRTKGKKGSAEQAHPFLQPVLSAGSFGCFPPTFSLYFLGQSPDKSSDVFLIAENANGQIHPLNAITVHKGMVKVQLILHSGPTRDTAPIGLAGLEKLFRSTTVIGLPAFALSPEGVAVNQIVPLKDAGGIKFEKWSFAVPVGAQNRLEFFEWRSDNLIKPDQTRPFERRLVRISTSTESGSEDILAKWTDDPVPEAESKLGVFSFQNSEAPHELGDYWVLAAILSLLRIVQISSEAKVATDGMLKAAGKLANFGLGFIG